MKSLFTPWRYDYITAPKDPDEPCFFCAAAADPEDPERLVVHATERHLVLLNRHPYSNGHLMVAPRTHLATPDAGDRASQLELWPLVLECRRTLATAYSPDGFNLGMNLGRVAGAGVPGHFHFHVVPRWSGDTNFMGVVAEVRLVPEALYDTWKRLRELFSRREG